MHALVRDVVPRRGCRKEYLVSAPDQGRHVLASVAAENDRSALEVLFIEPLPPAAFNQFVADVTAALNRALFGTPSDPATGGDRAEGATRS